MQQSSITIDPTVCHASVQSNSTLCGLAYFTDKQDQEKIIQDAVRCYRLMVFFKNYPYEGPADLLLVYLWVVLSHQLRTVEREKTEDGVRKKLMEIARENVPKPGDKNFFMGSLVRESGNLTEVSNYQTYLKSLKEQLAQELLKILYYKGEQSNDFKFWVGISKRKFMGLSYSGI